MIHHSLFIQRYGIRKETSSKTSRSIIFMCIPIHLCALSVAVSPRFDARQPCLHMLGMICFTEHNNFSDSALFSPEIMRKLGNAGKMDGIAFLDQVKTLTKNCNGGLGNAYMKRTRVNRALFSRSTRSRACAPSLVQDSRYFVY